MGRIRGLEELSLIHISISRNIKKNIGYGENQGPYQNNNGQWGPPYSNGPAGPQAGPDGSNPGGPYQNGAGGWQQGNPAQGAPGQGAPLSLIHILNHFFYRDY